MVRLKSGDPLIFGRAAEEMEALGEAGVEFEVVPGITSALSAAAAIPALADGPEMRFQRDNSPPGIMRSRTTRAAMPAVENTTRIVYMPGRDLTLLAAEWRERDCRRIFPARWCRGRRRRGRKFATPRWANLRLRGRCRRLACCWRGGR